MPRTVLDRGLSGACALVVLVGLFTFCVFSTILTAFKVKSEEKYYLRIEFYNSTESELVASEELTQDYASRMDESNLWQLIRKLFHTDSIALGLLLAVFAGGAVFLTLAMHMLAVLYHNPRTPMTRRLESYSGLARWGFSYPVFVALFSATIGQDFVESQSRTFSSDDDESALVLNRWTYCMLGRYSSAALLFTVSLFLTQVFNYIIFYLGRTQRPLPSPSEMIMRYQHEPTWSLRSRTAERRGRARRRGFTTFPLLVSLVCVCVGLFMPVVHIAEVFSQDLDVEFMFDGAAETSTFEYVVHKSSKFSVWGLSKLALRGHTLAQRRKYARPATKFLLQALCCCGPVIRALVSLLLWLVPTTTILHQVLLACMEAASTVICADVAVVVLIISHFELKHFVMAEFKSGVADQSKKLNIKFTGWFAALVAGVLLEAATSSWVRWRLSCELVDGTGPARLRTFKDWLLSSEETWGDSEVQLHKQEQNQLLPEETKEFYD